MKDIKTSSVCDVFFGVFFPTQDWWDGVRNAMEKPGFDKKRMGGMFEEMFASLGDGDAVGHGTFRKKFIKVWGRGAGEGVLSDAFFRHKGKTSNFASCDSDSAMRPEIKEWFLFSFSDCCTNA